VTRRRGVLLGALAAGALASRPASAAAKLLTVVRRPAETFTLSNGLQVVVLASRRAPLISQMVLYKAGSADEPKGQSGVAHFLEHMMFKGTSSVPVGEFSRTVSRNGGRDNAFTSYDITAYHQTIASDRLDLVMRLEADRMSNLIVTQKELTPERQVVLEERRMRTDNVPGELLEEAVREALFGQGRPYGVPVIGSIDEIKKLTVNDITAFYRRRYMPNNAVLIVAGDTSGEAVRKLAERFYGLLPARKVEARKRPDTPGPNLPLKVMRADARVVATRWSCDFIAPSYRMGETQHAYALQVLAKLFGGGETSRLWRALVTDRRIALEADADYNASQLGLTSFGVGAQLAPDRTIAEIEDAVTDEMKKVLDGAVTPQEVESAQNQLLAQAIYAQDSFASGPRIYASTLSTGGTTDDVEAWPQRLSAVTADQVTAAARAVWRKESGVTSLLEPAGGQK
jgi:zinc protease